LDKINGRVDSGRQALLKSVGCKSFVGSNPISSAKLAHGITVITLVFDTSNPGSIPGVPTNNYG
tara:strand:+ start:625 stop:816 length:192 start_codon:yes stop_codon:yes gene_type:complete